MLVTQLSPDGNVIFVFSYFFASNTLTVGALESLAKFVRTVADNRKRQQVFGFYTNSTNPLANKNYEVFKHMLGIDPDQTPPDHVTIEYRKKKGGEPTEIDFLHQVLTIGEK